LLHTDLARLFQMLGNLLNNAAKYMDEGDASGCRQSAARGR
jgi:signal transduction histidine kinase